MRRPRRPVDSDLSAHVSALEEYDYTEKPQTAPLVQMIEPMNGIWNASTNWGNSVGPLPVPAESTVVEVGRLDKTPGPPRVYTIQLFRSDLPIQNSNYAVRARITYGIGATQNSFDCDWFAGGQISLVCSYVKVEAVFYNPLPTFIQAYTIAAGATITLGCAFGAGNSGSSAPICYTANNLVANTIGTANVSIPDYAKALTVRTYDLTTFAGNDIPGTAFNVSVQQTNFGGAFSYSDASLWASVPVVPLNGGCTFIHLANTRANNVLVNCIFQLSL